MLHILYIPNIYCIKYFKVFTVKLCKRCCQIRQFIDQMGDCSREWDGKKWSLGSPSTTVCRIEIVKVLAGLTHND